MKTTTLRRLTSMTYGDALAADVRIDGTIPVFSSGGNTGSHSVANTLAPSIIVGRKGSHGSIWWSDRAAFVIDTAYSIDATNTRCDLRWLYYLLSSLRLNEMSNDVGVPGLSREKAYEAHVPAGVPSGQQRRIADFLDDQVSRVDNVISARRQQVDALEDEFNSIVFSNVRGGRIRGERKDSGLNWLGSIPVDWPMLTVQNQFEVLLGRMLDEKRETGEHSMPYLRNTNVQWDRIDTYDLKSMDIQPSEVSRFSIKMGDLLICEGGQPGRAAIWDGRIGPIAYQKALHRARSRGESDPWWLLNCLRAAVAVNAFAIENGQTTIGHLTSEQLRSQKLPFPERPIQATLLHEIDVAMNQRSAGEEPFRKQIAFLIEYKQSLITAAVTGELDVTTASKATPA